MDKKNLKRFLIIPFLIALTDILSTSIVVGQEGPFTEIKEKMAGISEIERENLQNLFALSQQIIELEKEEEGITRVIKMKREEIRSLKLTIEGEEMAYSKKVEDLTQVLKSYQRMGPGTYLEIILSSDSLAMLLRRITTLRDFTRNTGKLINTLEESNAKLSKEKSNLDEKISLLEESKKQLQESLVIRKQLIEKQEKYAASLQEEREYYEENLADLQQNWDELRTSVPTIIKELSTIFDERNIPPEELNISYFFTGIKGSISEESLNALAAGHPLLPKMELSLTPGNMRISIPEKDLIIIGNFIIQEEHTIRFEVQEGSFYDMPLGIGAIEDLFPREGLVFDLKFPMSNYTLKSIKATDEYLEWIITIN